jgi:hypothetical protein
VAHRRPDFGIGRFCHQAMLDRHEIFVDNIQPRFGEQEVNVGNPAVKRIFNRNDRASRRALFHRIDRILEGKAGHRKAAGSIIHRSKMRIGTGGALKGNRLFRHFSAFFGHFPDHAQCVFRKTVHHAPLLLGCDSRTGPRGARKKWLVRCNTSYFAFTIAPITAIEALRWPVALFTDSTNLAGQ